MSALCGSSSYSSLLTQKDGLSFMISASTAPPRNTAMTNMFGKAQAASICQCSYASCQMVGQVMNEQRIRPAVE